MRRLRRKSKPPSEKYLKLARRRAAVRALNAVAEELQLGVSPFKTKETDAGVVTRRIRLLEPRCQEGDLPGRLRAAVEMWHNNGGKLTREVIPNARSDMEGEIALDDALEDGEHEDEVPAVPMHKVLDSSFRLQSKAFMLTFNSQTFTRQTWPSFRKHMRQLCRTLQARAWAANWEVSLESSSPAGQTRFHGHGYLLWTDNVGVQRRNTDELQFNGVRPRVDVCTALNPKTFRISACRGLWYVSVHKKGTWRTATNFPPWRQYTPKAGWLEDLWAAHKLTEEQYRNLSRHFGSGHAARRRDVLDALRDAREEAVRAHVLHELRLLRSQGKIRKVNSYPVITSFVQLFAGEAKLRRPILAIIGGTNLGKSMLAADVLLQVARVLGLPLSEEEDDEDASRQPFLEVTVEDSTEVDLSEFDLTTQSGVLFDGVGDVAFLKKNREVLQGRPKICKGGKSGTMIYSYVFSLSRRAVVATFDLSAANLRMFRTHHWLSDPRNVLQLHLDQPAWDTQDAEVMGPVLSPREKMASWSVDDLADFLIAEDMRGPAQILQSAAVSGADFLQWQDAATLQNDLRLLPFVAAKLLVRRDDFLAGSV